MYKFKALGANMFAGYMKREFDSKDDINVVRFWARYNF